MASTQSALTGQSANLTVDLLPGSKRIVKQGYVVKRAVSAKVFKVWRERFVVLRPQSISWQMEPDSQILGALEVSAMSSVEPHPKLKNTLEFRSNGGTLLLQCESENACAKWIVTIEDQIKALSQPANPYAANDIRAKFYDDYELDDKPIGQGSYGDVCVGRHKKSGEERAVKIIQRAALLTDGVDLKIVEREVNILLTLRHENICFVESFYKTDDSVYLVCEYCKGGDLFTRMEEKGRYTEDKTRIIMKKLISAIAFCHEQGVLHRDLKLENVVLEKEEDETSVKLIDFGLARPYDAQENSSYMTAHVGTQGYHAPEILDKSASGYFDRKCPEKVDVWGLGIIMYMLLTAMHPFWHKNPVIMNRRIMKGQFDLAPMRRHGTSDEAHIFLGKCLILDAVRRYSAAELLKHKWLAE